MGAELPSHRKPDFEAFQQLQLFEYQRFIAHHFLLPKVMEIVPVCEPNNGHDDFIDQREAEELSHRLFGGYYGT